MAKKITKDDNQNLDAAELKDALNKALAEGSKAKEHNAEVSTIVRGALEKFGIDRTAFAMTRRIHKMGDDARQATLRDMLNLFVVAGFFDQRDAFDDPLEKLVAKLQEGKAAKKPAIRAVQ